MADVSDDQLEVFKSLSEYGRDALKAAMIINGGASIAILAFIGNVADDNLLKGALHLLAFAILFFCLGVVSAGTASIFAYRYRIFLIERNSGFDKLGQKITEKKRTEITEKIKKSNKNVNMSSTLTNWLLGGSYVFFAVGIFISIGAILSKSWP